MPTGLRRKVGNCDILNVSLGGDDMKTVMTSRRSFIAGTTALLAAPAILTRTRAYAATPKL